MMRACSHRLRSNERAGAADAVPASSKNSAARLTGARPKSFDAQRRPVQRRPAMRRGFNRSGCHLRQCQEVYRRDVPFCAWQLIAVVRSTCIDCGACVRCPADQSSGGVAPACKHAPWRVGVGRDAFSSPLMRRCQRVLDRYSRSPCAASVAAAWWSPSVRSGARPTQLEWADQARGTARASIAFPQRLRLLFSPAAGGRHSSREDKKAG